jgi:AcrR family transcriptional regulator
VSPARVEVEAVATGDASWPPAKRAMYEAALRLFWQRGFRPTSVQDIVESVGLTKGAFYHYFESKDDLIIVMQDRYMDAEIPKFRKIAESEVPPKTALSLVIAEIVESIIAFRSEVAVFFDEWRMLDEEHFSAIKRRRDELESLIIKVVDKAVREGAIKSALPPRLIAFALIGMSYYTTYWWRPGGGLTAQDLGAHYADLFTGGAPEAAGRAGAREPGSEIIGG